MTIVQDATQEQIKALRELMEEKFRTVNQRFNHLEKMLAFDKRLTALEERQSQPPAPAEQ